MVHHDAVMIFVLRVEAKGDLHSLVLIWAQLRIMPEKTLEELPEESSTVAEVVLLNLLTILKTLQTEGRYEALSIRTDTTKSKCMFIYYLCS